MSMIKYYFDNSKEDNIELFQGLNIDKAGEQYKEYMGKYPVIYLSLKDIKFNKWKETYNGLIETIADEFNKHSELENSTNLSSRERMIYCDICNEKAPKSKYVSSLKTLTRLLEKHYGVKPILLIYEYDIPIQSGFINDFYEDIIEFMRLNTSSNDIINELLLKTFSYYDSGEDFYHGFILG